MNSHRLLQSKHITAYAGLFGKHSVYNNQAYHDITTGTFCSELLEYASNLILL